ncbi:hypothetical protein F4703DRAFT_1737663 [Phycomyces blakesleeanus]
MVPPTVIPAPVIDVNYQPSVRIRDIERERPQLGSRQRKNEFEPYSNGDITNISQHTEAFIEYPRRPAKMLKLDESYQKKPGESYFLDISSLASVMPIDYTTINAPSWFDIKTVHQIEKMALPEFFDPQGKKSEQLAKDYMHYRDFMINTYRANPDFYLTAVACKDKLDADIVSLVRIHSFLELYGLINAQVDPRRRIFDPYVDSEPEAGVKPKSQRDYRNVNNVDMQYLRDLIFDPSITADKKSAWDLSIEDDTNPDIRKIYVCSTCQTDCSLVRYQCLKHKQVYLCIDCFLEGRFTSTLSSGDFLRVESSNDRYGTDEEWSNSEILRLLEGVDKYDDDWLMISEHVGIRSKEQCITQFLQLPISDTFLTAQLADKELEELPFGDQPNPVMTMIAFISGHINPGVGAAAAKAALKELLQSEEAKNEMDIDNNDDEYDDEEDEDEEDEENDEEDNERQEKLLFKGLFSPETMKKATMAGLLSAVEQAKKLASYEDQEIQHWTRLAVKTLVDKISLKVQQYDELETSLDNERKELEKQGLVLTSSIENLHRQYAATTAITSGTTPDIPTAITPTASATATSTSTTPAATASAAATTSTATSTTPDAATSTANTSAAESTTTTITSTASTPTMSTASAIPTNITTAASNSTSNSNSTADTTSTTPTTPTTTTTTTTSHTADNTVI